MKRYLGMREGGFTLVEMTVVIAIIAVLAALALPAVTGVTTDTRASSKAGDQKSVQQATVRFSDQNGGTLPSSTTPTDNVIDEAPFDGIIKIIVDVGTPTAGVAPADADVICLGDNTPEALDECFGGIDFTDLVPTYMSVAPRHANDSVSPVTPGDNNLGTADLTIDNCTLAGDTCEFYLQDSETLSTLSVWNVTSAGAILTLKDDNFYGQ